MNKGHPMDLFLRISVLQANFCWLKYFHTKRNKNCSRTTGTNLNWRIIRNANIIYATFPKRREFNEEIWRCWKLSKLRSKENANVAFASQIYASIFTFFARSKLMQIHFFLQSSALRVPHSFHTEKKNFSSLCVKNVRSVPRVWSQNTSNGN